MGDSVKHEARQRYTQRPPSPLSVRLNAIPAGPPPPEVGGTGCSPRAGGSPAEQQVAARFPQPLRVDAHLPGSSPRELPGQVAADAPAPAGDEHALPGQVPELGRQHRAHGSFHHQINHLHGEKQQSAQPFPNHPLLPGKPGRQNSLPTLHRTKLREKENHYPSCTPGWVTSLRPPSETWGATDSWTGKILLFP